MGAVTAWGVCSLTLDPCVRDKFLEVWDLAQAADREGLVSPK